ncbi:MAG: glutamine--fructose-6-phosphate transaminase (isomerizing) [Ruminococcaceae bacterium]|nr:glutamine--fructose-6-phosphate transaminase (isomerizing) [Oscillospiraceae bacterium]
MCGIIGYTGNSCASPKITKGLSVLEYRGYDSVGIAAANENEISIIKCKGRITSLEEKLSDSLLQESHTAIGHTRWATHGGPSDTNAHPHRVGDVVLVHNGIIENYMEIKKELTESGVKFSSETDTEVAAAWINRCYCNLKDPIPAIREACSRFTGSYAFAIMFENLKGEIYAIRRGSPLILAEGKDGYYLASDITALLPFTPKYHILDENSIACLKSNEIKIFSDSKDACIPEWKITSITPEAAQKGGFSHFMLKEIHEQPEAILKSVSPRIINGLPDFSGDGIHGDFWKKIKNIQIVACGSATHAGLAGGYFLEKLAKIPTSSYIASEYRYTPPIATDGTLVILISQSGETADTLAALRYAKAHNIPTLAIVNAVETTIAREADYKIYTYAGPEIAVATTKGYCTQVSVLYMIAVAIAHQKGDISDQTAKELVENISQGAPKAISHILSQRNILTEIAKKLYRHEHVFYIGRGIDFHICAEASLKLKEISYIHSEAYAAGELKHGTISLIENDTPVIAIVTENRLYEKTESNLREVKSRGADVILICRDDISSDNHSTDSVLTIPSTSDVASVFAAIAAVQIIAFDAALLRNCDIDRPRNLAKSVTVE